MKFHQRVTRARESQFCSLAQPAPWQDGWKTGARLSSGNRLSPVGYGLLTGRPDPGRQRSKSAAETGERVRLRLQSYKGHFCRDRLVKVSHKASSDSRGTVRDPRLRRSEPSICGPGRGQRVPGPAANEAELCCPRPCAGHTFSEE